MHILCQDINALLGMIHIYRVEQTDEGKVSTRNPVKSVKLAVVNKHQDTNVNIRGFVIVKYKGTFYAGEVFHLVPNQSATVSTMECSGLKFWEWPAKQDVLDYPLHDIERVIKPPTMVSNHSTFSVMFMFVFPTIRFC